MLKSLTNYDLFSINIYFRWWVSPFGPLGHNTKPKSMNQLCWSLQTTSLTMVLTIVILRSMTIGRFVMVMQSSIQRNFLIQHVSFINSMVLDTGIVFFYQRWNRVWSNWYKILIFIGHLYGSTLLSIQNVSHTLRPPFLQTCFWLEIQNPSGSQIMEHSEMISLKISREQPIFQVRVICWNFLTKGQNIMKLKGNTLWWQGFSSGYVDFTNELAAQWWIERLERLRLVANPVQYNVEMFYLNTIEQLFLFVEQ